MDERDIKLDRLLDMQDNPENYTDEELEAMLNDPDMQEDIKCLVAMRRAATPHPPIWGASNRRNATMFASIADHSLTSKSNSSEDHSQTNKPNVSEDPKSSEGNFALKGRTTSPHMGGLGGRWWTIAALFIGCIIAYAAVRFVQERTPMPIAEKTGAVVEKAEETPEIKTDTVTTAKATLIVFDGEEMEVVAHDMAEYYGVNVRFDSEEAKHVKLFFRWDKKMPLENIVEILNKYDRINIELVDGTIVVK